MSGMPNPLKAHLATGTTTICRAWAITRADGVTLGFTDHDLDLTFDGIVFQANTGLSGAAIAQSTGLSVDNTEAIGALNTTAIREADIEAGRYDNAGVRAWLVNWTDPTQRWLQFRGHLGEVRRSAGAFQAELRGLTDGLNQTIGRSFQKPCSAVLGDRVCRFDLTGPGYRHETTIEQVENARIFTWSEPTSFAPGWFARGRVDVLDGDAVGLWGNVKSDRIEAGKRVVELWQPIGAALAAGDRLRLSAGCDKRFGTCRQKFNNALNFQGFPDIPGDDWLVAVPKSTGRNGGGSLR